jgi:hypothetical protein
MYPPIYAAPYSWLKRFLLLLPVAACLAAPALAETVIIVNPRTPLASIGKADLRAIFLGAPSDLADTLHLTPVLLRGGPTHEEFLAGFVGKQQGAFTAGWRSIVFSGHGSMPKSVDDEAAMVEYVAHTLGAVGYIAAATPHAGVRVIAVK